MAQMRIYTDYDFDQLVQLQRVVGETLNPKAVRSQRLSGVLGGLGFAGAGILLAWKGQGVLSLAFCLLGLFFILPSLGYYQVAAWRAQRGQKGSRGCDYVMDKTVIRASRGREFASYPYTDCRTLLETEDAFYLLLDREGIVLAKGTLRGGTVEELRDLLTRRCAVEPQWMGKGKGPETCG